MFCLFELCQQIIEVDILMNVILLLPNLQCLFISYKIINVCCRTCYMKECMENPCKRTGIRVLLAVK